MTVTPSAADCLLFERNGVDFTARVMRYPPHFTMRAHAHEEAGISVILAGAVVEEAQHRSVTARAGWAVIKPRAMKHANRFGPAGATILSLTPRGAGGMSLRWTWIDTPGVLRAALRLVSARETDPDHFTDLLSEFPAPKAATSDTGWLTRIKARLEEDCPVKHGTVQSFATEAGFHPVYLARQFRARYGVSIREYRKIVQVRRAIELIAGTRRPLSEIAHSCGFADHSHMCRSFQAVAHSSPRAFRFG